MTTQERKRHATWLNYRGDTPEITVSKGGMIRLNQAAYQAIGSPEVVTYAVDKQSQTLTIRGPAEGRKPYVITRLTGPNPRATEVIGASCYGRKALRDLGIGPLPTRSYRPQIQDGTLVIYFK